MSKIDELINELCPDGVVRCRLGDVCDFMSGFAFKSSLYTPDGEPICKTTNIQNGVIDFSQMEYFRPMDYGCDLSGYIIYPQDIVIGMSGSIKVGINQTNEKCYLNQRVGKFIPYDGIINNKYLYYLLCDSETVLSDKVSGGSVKNLSNKDITNLEICVPPMEVQIEIVHILDNFTKLTAELTAELAARKRQYEYYRDTLLSFDGRDDFEMSTIGSLSNYRRGSFPQPYGNREWYDGDGAMPFVQVADIGDDMLLIPDTKRKISKIAQPKSVFAPAGSIIISLQGSIGRIAITQYDAFIDRTVAIFQDIDKKILPKYFVYQLQRVFAIKEKTARGSTIKTITKEEFTSFPIPIPSIEEQERVVNILDRFNTLCSDVAEGLPAEIIGRNRQYEYYRDKLLTFKELKAA